MATDTIRISAIAFPEGDHWIVQGIEYDIVARASDAGQVPDAFAKAVFENVCITRHLGREPLGGIKPAPERFRLLFERAKTRLSPVTPRQDGPHVDIRLAEAA